MTHSLQYHPRKTRTLALLSLVCAMAPSIASSARGNSENLTIEPIIQFSKGAIKSCGIAFRAREQGDELTVLLTNERDTQSTVTKLTATGPDTVSIQGVAISIEAMSTSAITGPANTNGKPSNPFQRVGKLTDDQRGTLFQQALVLGFKLDIETTKGTYSWRHAGPAPQNVRSMYLMCSGDLYRP